MKESRSVEARRRRALPYYNVKRRRQKEREREAERSRRRREEQQDADQRRTSARMRQQQRRAITPAVTGSGRVYLGPMTTVCHHWKHHHRRGPGEPLRPLRPWPDQSFVSQLGNCQLELKLTLAVRNLLLVAKEIMN